MPQLMVCRVIYKVELWDCSGDERFRGTWSAMVNDIHGALFVTSADGKYDKELDDWQQSVGSLKPNQIVIYAHKVLPGSAKGKAKPGNLPSN
jgi:hypothetical protein